MWSESFDQLPKRVASRCLESRARLATPDSALTPKSEPSWLTSEPCAPIFALSLERHALHRAATPQAMIDLHKTPRKADTCDLSHGVSYPFAGK